MQDPEDPYDRPLTERRTSNTLGGLVIAVLGLAAMFASGFYFDVFGKPITFQKVGDYAFYGSIWFAVFGVFWCMFSAWAAFRFTVCVMAAFLGLYIAGKLSRGEL